MELWNKANQKRRQQMEKGKTKRKFQDRQSLAIKVKEEGENFNKTKS
jgi:hypothetical protein